MHLKDVTDVLIGKRPRDSTILKPANGAYGSGFSVRTIGGSRAGMWVMRVVRSAQACEACGRAERAGRMRSCGSCGSCESCGSCGSCQLCTTSRVVRVVYGSRPLECRVERPLVHAVVRAVRVAWVVRAAWVVCDRASHTGRVRSCVGRASRVRSCAEGRKSNPFPMPKNRSLVYPIGVFFRYISCYYNEVMLD